MLILVGVLVISAAFVGYLIWSNGGFVKRPEHVMITHSVPGFTLRQAEPTDIEALVRIVGEPESMESQGWDAAALETYRSSA